MIKHPPLYIKKQNKVSGPFPPKQISQGLLLGRFKLTDEVSEDRENWIPIQSRSDIVPEVLVADPADEEAQEKLQAARRWADERRPDHGAASDTHQRAAETDETIEYRNHRESVYSRFLSRREASIIQTLIVLALLASLVYASFFIAPGKQIAEPTCDQPAAEGVVWRNCIMNGLQSLHANLSRANLDSAILSNANLFASDLTHASVMYTNLSLANLSYTNFSHANLKGSNLQRADLSHANLSNANLTYVDFTNANIDGVKLEGAILDNAIWINGQVCLAGSVGACNIRKN